MQRLYIAMLITVLVLSPTVLGRMSGNMQQYQNLAQLPMLHLPVEFLKLLKNMHQSN